MCLDVNQGGTNRNRCYLPMSLNRTPKLGHCDLLFGSKSPAEKSGREGIDVLYIFLWREGLLQPVERHRSMVQRRHDVNAY